MFYVLILHTLGQGGVLDAATEGSHQYMLAWFLELWAITAVDIFALISGYVANLERDGKSIYSNGMVLWLQVVVYGVIVTLLYHLFHPELVTMQDLPQMFFPVTNGLYWYFSAYIGLLFLMPVLNAGLRKCSEEFLKKFFIVLILVFSIFDTIAEQFYLIHGYSFIWLVILYLLGAIMKKCQIGSRMRWYQSFLIIVLCCVLGWVFRIYGTDFKVFNINVTRSLAVAYTSPTVLIASIFYIIGFSKLSFYPWLKKLISFSAAGAFAAYILNCQSFVWQFGMEGKFTYLADKKLVVLFFHTIVFAFAFLVVSIVIDHIRIWLFQVFRVNQFAKWIVTRADRLLSGKKAHSPTEENADRMFR